MCVSLIREILGKRVDVAWVFVVSVIMFLVSFGIVWSIMERLGH